MTPLEYILLGSCPHCQHQHMGGGQRMYKSFLNHVKALHEEDYDAYYTAYLNRKFYSIVDFDSLGD